MTRGGTGECRLLHVPDGRVNPSQIVELGAGAADIEHRDLRPERVRVHVEIVGRRDALAVHDSHVLGTDDDEMLNAHAGRVVVEEEERLLAELGIDTLLCVGREPVPFLCLWCNRLVRFA